jgi:hypothetical protein
MPRFARKLLIASRVAFHATVMLCGPCLHGVPGWDHGPELSQAAADGDQLRGPAQGAHVSPDDCPVCHLASLAQLPVDCASVPAARLVSAFKAETFSAPVTPSLHRPTSPRAPPAPSTHLS